MLFFVLDASSLCGQAHTGKILNVDTVMVVYVFVVLLFVICRSMQPSTSSLEWPVLVCWLWWPLTATSASADQTLVLYLHVEPEKSCCFNNHNFFLFLGQKMTSRSYNLLILAAWLNAMFWSSMPVVGWAAYAPDPTGATCTINWRQNDAWVPVHLRGRIPDMAGLCWLSWTPSQRRHAGAQRSAAGWGGAQFKWKLFGVFFLFDFFYNLHIFHLVQSSYI